MTIEQIIKENKCSIVDVRTYEEFQGGHVVDSLNLPLHIISDQVETMKKMPQPIVLVCASGGRSGQAAQYLSQCGIDCVNGGPWTNVNYFKSL